ncbi:MAG: hydrogenase 4 subunit B, partial [Rhizomicrobium sp.]
MQVEILLWCVLALLITAGVAICLSKRPAATVLVYGAAAIISAAGSATALSCLYESQQASLRLPLGLPWMGANFHLDALSAFFLVVINLGAAAASLYALGYGRHEQSPERVLP